MTFGPQEIANRWGRVDRTKAIELIVLLQKSDNLQAPDVQDVAANVTERNGEIGDYLLGMAGLWQARRLQHSGNRLGMRGSTTESDIGSRTVTDLSSRGMAVPAHFPTEAVNCMVGAMHHMMADAIGDELETPEVICAQAMRLTDDLDSPFFLASDPLDCNGLQELIQILQPLGQSPFVNVVLLATPTGNRPLSAVVIFAVCNEKLHKRLKLNLPKMVKFVMKIEDGYPDNPYHNRSHAADVTQRMYSIMRMLPFTKGPQYDIYLLAAIFSAAIHDVLHPGYNNAFLTRTEDVAARQFNDQSVAENWALYTALGLMRKDETNFIADSKLCKDDNELWREFPCSSVRKWHNVLNLYKYGRTPVTAAALYAQIAFSLDFFHVSKAKSPRPGWRECAATERPASEAGNMSTRNVDRRSETSLGDT
eukprot:scaffold74439_cov33-Prasinocladus_malaysianus.AAC.2